MASTINDFSKWIKKMAPDVGFANNYNGEKDYNSVRSNPFRRAVTVNNTGKTVKSNYLISFTLDTKAIYALNQCAWTFSDLRVYDSDGTTELSFWVEAPNTEFTTIFVKIPSLTAASKTIYLEYGNPGLENKASLVNTCGAIFGTSKIQFWGRPNEALRVTGGAQNDGWRAYYLENQKGGPLFSMIQPGATPMGGGGNQPSYNYSAVNGLPEITFDSANSQHLYQNYLPDVPVIPASTAYHIFAVAGRTSNKSTNYIIGDNGTGATNQSLHFGWRTDTVFTLAQYGNDLDVTVSGYSSKTWQLFEGEHITGLHRIFLNGAQIGSNTNGTGLAVNNKLKIGVAQGGYYQGGLGDVIICLPGSSGLTTQERADIRVYLNTKYRVYSTSDMPTITVGSQTNTNAAEWTYTSYAPFVSFRENIKANIATYPEAEGSVKVKNLLQKTLAVGNSVETWSLSSVDKTGQYISVHECRKRTATTSAGVDSVVIERLDGSNNRGDLGKFEVDNIVEATVYSSTDSDYIEWELWVSDSSLISTTNSYIRFENSGNTLSYQANLTKNENLLTSGILNLVRMKKSDFTKSGSGTWTNASYRCKINIQTTSGSQTVAYGKVRLVRRLDSAAEFDFNHPVRLRNCVSSDNDATYYCAQMQNGRISNRKITDEEVELDTEDYLKIIQYKKFSDFDSFPKRYVAWDYDREDPTGDNRLRYYTFAMKKILGFVFPASALDIDLDLKADDIQLATGEAASPMQLQFFWILGDEQVEDKVETILKACGGMLFFNPSTGKITARNWYKIGDLTAGLLPTRYDIQNIIDYKTADSKDEPTYNYVEQDALIAMVNSVYGAASGLDGIGVGGIGHIAIRNTGSSSALTVFLTHEELTRGDVHTVLTNNLHIGGFLIRTTPDASTFDNTGVKIIDFKIIGQTVAVTFQNTTGADRYLAAISFGADFLRYSFFSHTTFGGSTIFRPKFTATLTNTAAKSRKGEQRYELNNVFSFCRYCGSAPTESQIASLPDFYSNIINQLDDAYLVQAEVVYDPNIYPSRYVGIRNKEGRLVSGFVTKVENYSQNGEYRTVVTVREV